MSSLVGMIPEMTSRVLLVTSSLAEADLLHKKLKPISDYFSFRYPSNVGRKRQSISDLIEDCSNVIRDEHIEAIISFHPDMHLVRAAICKLFPELEGASFESCFLCLHAYYSRQMITQGLTPPCMCLDDGDLDAQVKNRGSDLLLAAEEHGERAILKPVLPMPCESVPATPCLVSTLVDQSKLTLDAFDREVKAQWAGYKHLVQRNLRTDIYPHAVDQMWVVEREPPGESDGTTLHYVEACVSDADLVPWAITDMVRCKDRPDHITSLSLPTRLPEASQFEVWAVFREITQRLVGHGFDNSFIHVTVAVQKEGPVQVLALVPGPNLLLTPLYDHVLQGVNNLCAHIQLSLGRGVHSPRVNHQRHAMLSRMFAVRSGTTLAKLINIAAANSEDNLVLLVPKDVTIETIPYGGVPLAQSLITGTSLRDCRQKLQTVYDRIMLPKRRNSRRHSLAAHLPVQLTGNNKLLLNHKQSRRCSMPVESIEEKQGHQNLNKVASRKLSMI